MVQEMTELNSEEIVSSKEIVFIKFYSDWCVPCKTLAPIVEKLAENYGDKIAFAQLKANENIAVARKYMVMGLPAIRILKNGEVVEAIQGLRNYEELETIIKQYI